MFDSKWFSGIPQAWCYMYMRVEILKIPNQSVQKGYGHPNIFLRKIEKIRLTCLCHKKLYPNKLRFWKSLWKRELSKREKMRKKRVPNYSHV